MRYLLAFLPVISLSIACADFASAQAPSKPPSNRQILRQDSDECAKEVADPHRVDLFSACMTKKQMARKEAVSQKKAEERAKRRQERSERFDAAMKTNQETNQQRIAQENAARAKRDDCKKQAKEQNLHLMKRLNFIKGCMEKK
jgi:hypothetical protein